jgi:hypothetical protein
LSYRSRKHLLRQLGDAAGKVFLKALSALTPIDGVFSPFSGGSSLLAFLVACLNNLYPDHFPKGGLLSLDFLLFSACARTDGYAACGSIHSKSFRSLSYARRELTKSSCMFVAAHLDGLKRYSLSWETERYDINNSRHFHLVIGFN